MPKKTAVRGNRKPSVWRNKEQRFKKERCTGTYKVFQGKRMFLLVDINDSKKRHRFDSHEAAKDRGWFKE